MAQGHFGAGLLALAQEGQVQGGGGLAGLEHQRAHTLIQQGLHIEDGGPEGGVVIRSVQRQHLALLTSGIKHLLAQQTLDGIAGLVLFLRCIGDHHDVALNGILHRGGVAAVVGVYLPHRNVRVEGNVALRHDALGLRGQIARDDRVIGSESAYAHCSGHGQQSGRSSGTACSVLVQSHMSYPPVGGRPLRQR